MAEKPGSKAASQELARAAQAYLAGIVRRFDGNATAAAEALGVSQPTVTNMMNGKNGVGFPMLEAMARLDGVGFDLILGRSLSTPPTRTVTLDARYPNRSRALEAWRLLRRDEEAAENVASLAMDRDDDPSPDEWFADLEREERRLNAERRGKAIRPPVVEDWDDAPRLPGRKK